MIKKKLIKPGNVKVEAKLYKMIRVQALLEDRSVMAITERALILYLKTFDTKNGYTIDDFLPIDIMNQTTKDINGI